MIYNVVLVSGIQQSDSVIHIHIFILFQILFPYRLLHNIEQSSLCYTVVPCWLSIFSKYLKIFSFIYLFMAALSLHYCAWAFSSCGECGLLFGCGARASHCGGFSC